MTIHLNYSILKFSFLFIFVLGWLFICIRLLHLQFSFDDVMKWHALSVKNKLIIIIVLLYKDQVTSVQSDLFIRPAQQTDDKELR